MFISACPFLFYLNTSAAHFARPIHSRSALARCDIGYPLALRARTVASPIPLRAAVCAANKQTHGSPFII